MPPALPPRNLPTIGNDTAVHPGRETEPWRRRRQLERQLHDGASLRISALTLRLGVLGEQVPPADEAQWRHTIAEVQDELHAALQELRAVERQIYPPVLDEAGLGPALRELADRHGVALELGIGNLRFGEHLEGAAYFAVSEWLSYPETGGSGFRITIALDGAQLVLALSPFQARQLARVRPHTTEAGGLEVLENATLWVRMPCE